MSSVAFRLNMHPTPFVAALVAGFLLIPAGRTQAITTEILIAPAGESNSDDFGGHASGAGDFNGDGFDDVIIGADFAGSGGRAYLLLGGPNADDQADFVFAGEAVDDNFGRSVSGAGDINGDGFSDVIVGAPQRTGSQFGKAYVYFGGVDADTTADLVIVAPAVSLLGTAVGAAGDINGDGFDDFAVRVSDGDGGVGKTNVYFGGASPDTTADLTLDDLLAGEGAAESPQALGHLDFNGDGYDDLVIGLGESDVLNTDAGVAYVYFGGPGVDVNFDLFLGTATSLDYFGESVGSAGDVNGDGYEDLVVGARGFNVTPGPIVDAGVAFVYFGGPASDDVADLVIPGAISNGELGASVAGVGDVNNDGFDDLIVGAPEDDTGGEQGKAFVYFGSAAPDSLPDLTFSGVVNGLMGSTVSSAGDFDGDGFDDVLLGDENAKDDDGFSTGRAYVYTPFPFRILSPNGGEHWAAGTQRTVRWQGHDVADLSLSVDGGPS
jgi:hypothetical protein